MKGYVGTTKLREKYLTKRNVEISRNRVKLGHAKTTTSKVIELV